MLPAVAGRNLRVFLIAALFAALAVQPLLHNHSLIPDDSEAHYSSSASVYCPFCAIGADRETFAPPALTAPLVVVYALPAYTPAPLAFGVDQPTSSRAPPAA
jgi:hypothetical protein